MPTIVSIKLVEYHIELVECHIELVEIQSSANKFVCF
jgi:hypothetical protein